MKMNLYQESGRQLEGLGLEAHWQTYLECTGRYFFFSTKVQLMLYYSFSTIPNDYDKRKGNEGRGMVPEVLFFSLFFLTILILVTINYAAKSHGDWLGFTPSPT